MVHANSVSFMSGIFEFLQCFNVITVENNEELHGVGESGEEGAVTGCLGQARHPLPSRHQQSAQL
jgi:hypothetical protein